MSPMATHTLPVNNNIYYTGDLQLYIIYICSVQFSSVQGFLEWPK